MQSVEVSAGLGIKVGRLVEEHGGVVPAEGPLRRVIYDAVIAVGDSAGQVLPLVGEGIRFSIMAGRKAGAALDGALDEPNNAERHLARYQAWWVGSYFKRFQLAQAVNLRITQYEDAQWDAGVKRISIIDAEMLGSLLRADALPWSAAKFLMRHPLAASSYLAEKMSRHLRK